MEVGQIVHLKFLQLPCTMQEGLQDHQKPLGTSLEVFHNTDSPTEVLQFLMLLLFSRVQQPHPDKPPFLVQTRPREENFLAKSILQEDQLAVITRAGLEEASRRDHILHIVNHLGEAQLKRMLQIPLQERCLCREQVITVTYRECNIITPVQGTNMEEISPDNNLETT